MSDRVQRLAAEAAASAEIRALTTHPDVIALRVEKVRAQVDVLLWAGIILGLAFTMVNVQAFAAAGAAVGTLPWLAAWLLDPMVSLVLIAVLRAEQVIARYQVETPAWARRTKWLTFASTYVMNTWPYWGLTEGRPLDPAGIVLHSVPPLVVFFAAETGPGLRDKLTEAVNRALIEHAHAETTGRDEQTPATVADLVAAMAARDEEPITEPIPVVAPEPAPAPAPAPLPAPPTPVFAASTPRPVQVHVPATPRPVVEPAETTDELPAAQPARRGTEELTATERMERYILREWDAGRIITGADVDNHAGTNPKNGLGRRRLNAMRKAHPGREPSTNRAAVPELVGAVG